MTGQSVKNPQNEAENPASSENVRTSSSSQQQRSSDERGRDHQNPEGQQGGTHGGIKKDAPR